ncbi:Gfo/Idh/MocA family protein [Cohnella sp. GCM10020058]|uniref:Gfo/Idh/MocA family protein n=1 Tax=Cohnella sp. GCM10020058 TaxID=3317330 RepID=UPI00362AF481
MWKVGLIGTGYWSVNHLNAWRRIPGAEIAALCNRSPGKLERRGAEFGIPHASLYTSLDDFFARDDVNVVDIVTGPETHLELVTRAARAGKHIMCQKPFASSPEEAEEMVRIAEACGVRLMVTENWRWLEPNQIIKRVLEKGTIGRVQVGRYIHTDYYTSRMAPGIPLPQPFFREMPRLLFYEMGAHWFDTLRFFFGDPQRLYAETLRVSPHIAGEDSGIVTLGYDDAYVVMDMSWATRRELDGPPAEQVRAEHREQIVIEGERGTVKLYMDGKITLIDGQGAETVVAERTELDHAESHFRLQSHFIECLNDGRPFQTSGEDNVRTLNLIFAVYRSAERHEVVRDPATRSPIGEA